jgi:hypothetical protein
MIRITDKCLIIHWLDLKKVLYVSEYKLFTVIKLINQLCSVINGTLQNNLKLIISGAVGCVSDCCINSVLDKL